MNTAGLVNIPNALSLTRLLLIPVLLWLAWNGHTTASLLVIGLCFASDALDGFFARLLHQRTRFGARLDSVADFAFYVSIPLATWWAWPELLLREVWFFLALLASVVVPALVAAVKFRAATSYHTWLVKVAALCTGLSLLLLLATDVNLPFRASVAISVLAALEEIAITLVLQRPRSNLRSLWHVLRSRHAPRAADGRR